jgi:hypothetical protein
LGLSPNEETGRPSAARPGTGARDTNNSGAQSDLLGSGPASEFDAFDDESIWHELANPGAEFFQLAEFLEENQDNDEAREAWIKLIREAAAALSQRSALP